MDFAILSICVVINAIIAILHFTGRDWLWTQHIKTMQRRGITDSERTPAWERRVTITGIVFIGFTIFWIVMLLNTIPG